MDKLMVEEVAFLQAEWEQFSLCLRNDKAQSMVLQDVRDYLMDLAKIHSRAIVLKQMLLNWSLTEREAFEQISKSWVMKGYAAGERESLWSMTSKVVPFLRRMDLIIDGCNAMTRYLQHILTVFQIEAKLSYVGHD